MDNRISKYLAIQLFPVLPDLVGQSLYKKMAEETVLCLGGVYAAHKEASGLK